MGGDEEGVVMEESEKRTGDESEMRVKNGVEGVNDDCWFCDCFFEVVFCVGIFCLVELLFYTDGSIASGKGKLIG